MQGANYNFDHMRLSTAYKYYFVRNGAIIEKGTYVLSEYENNIFPGEYSIRFSSKNKIDGDVSQITDKEMIINTISRDSISLCDGMIDGFCYYFEKQ